MEFIIFFALAEKTVLTFRITNILTFKYSILIRVIYVAYHIGSKSSDTYVLVKLVSTDLRLILVLSNWNQIWQKVFVETSFNEFWGFNCNTYTYMKIYEKNETKKMWKNMRIINIRINLPYYISNYTVSHLTILYVSGLTIIFIISTWCLPYLFVYFYPCI